MNTETYDMVRKFWSNKFGFDPQGEREEKILLELIWVSVQNPRVLREINRASRRTDRCTKQE